REYRQEQVLTPARVNNYGNMVRALYSELTVEKGPVDALVADAQRRVEHLAAQIDNAGGSSTNDYLDTLMTIAKELSAFSTLSAHFDTLAVPRALGAPPAWGATTDETLVAAGAFQSETNANKLALDELLDACRG